MPSRSIELSEDAPYEEHLPARSLAPFVDRLWTKRERAPREDARVLPDGCVDVLFHLGARPRAVVVGAMTRARVVPAGPSDIVAVRFRPGGAARIFGVPIDALTDTLVDLAELGIDARAAIDALTSARSIEARREVVERFVASHRRARAEDRITARAVARLVAPGAPRIAALADELGITRQHLTRRVRAAVGIGPKELARIARAQRAIAAITRGEHDHAAIAIEHGYADQAHMVHELGALTGLTPRALARASGSISPITSAYDLAEGGA